MRSPSSCSVCGTRMVHPLSRKWRFSSPTMVAAAYVENCTSRDGSNRSIAPSSPMFATWIRSSSGSPRPANRRARYSASGWDRATIDSFASASRGDVRRAPGRRRHRSAWNRSRGRRSSSVGGKGVLDQHDRRAAARVAFSRRGVDETGDDLPWEGLEQEGGRPLDRLHLARDGRSYRVVVGIEREHDGRGTRQSREHGARGLIHGELDVVHVVDREPQPSPRRRRSAGAGHAATPDRVGW